jgi:solute carrier family 30 (zinc transporter), member 9
MPYVPGNKSVVVALIGNTFVTIIKVIAAVLSGSISMFAESVHSFADTLNQSLLLIGITRSKRSADHIRGYGYGIERFFWSLISACGVLFVGAGVTIYHSIASLTSQGAHGGTAISLAGMLALVIAAVVEGATFFVAFKELKRGRKLSRKIFTNADPVTLAVVYEDGVAVLGVIVALAAQLAAHFTNNNVYDSIGGIIVGSILGILAIVLIIKNYSYLIGKPLSQKKKDAIMELLEEDPCIEKILDFKSEAVDVRKYRIFITVEWNGAPLYKRIYQEGDLKEEYDEVKDDFGEFTKLIFSTVDRVPRLVGNHIDIIEKRIIENFPEIAYIDIEIN